jgi:peptide-methionine (S)-S-oxide reductase
MWSMLSQKVKMVSPDEALPGRDAAIPVPPRHFVNGNPLKPPFPAGIETAVFALGCFWGA